MKFDACFLEQFSHIELNTAEITSCSKLLRGAIQLSTASSNGMSHVTDDVYMHDWSVNPRSILLHEIDSESNVLPMPLWRNVSPISSGG